MLPSILEIRSSIDRGERSAVEIVSDALDGIARLEPAVRAWVCVAADAAIRQAEKIESKSTAPLNGIPVGIKDIIDVSSLPTRCGSSLTSPLPVVGDAPVVSRLRRAGAVILGKTVTTEWACFDPSVTRNPWNLGHTPGGSSSGSAASVACGMCVAALGTQTGGSIIRPAAYCGLAGLKPTFGSLPMDRIAPVSSHLDHVGPIARSIADLRILWEVLSGRKCRYQGTSDIRLGRLGDGFVQETATEFQTCYDEAVDDVFSKLNITRVALNSFFADVHDMHYRIMASEAAAFHRKRFTADQDSFGPQVASLIEDGMRLPAREVAEALQLRWRLRTEARRLFDGVDALMMPATDAAAPPTLSTTGSPRFNSPWSFLGLPAVCIPLAVDRGGMPIGLQLIGPFHDEDRLLAIAEVCERAIRFDRRPPQTTCQ